LRKRIMKSFFIPLLLFMWVPFSSIVHGTELAGRYSSSIANYFVFEDGVFTFTYITTKYGQSVEAETMSEPAQERETICTARGEYFMQLPSIELSYDSDTCALKKGFEEVIYDAITDSLDVNGKQYHKVIASTTGQSLSVRSARSVMSTVQSIEDVTAGVNAWKWQVAQAMENLNNNSDGIWYCSSSTGVHLDPFYWTWSSSVGRGGWIPAETVNPSNSIDWYFGSVMPGEGCTECLMAARAVFYKGLLETIGQVAFDNWFSDKRPDLVISALSRAPSPVRMNKPLQEEADLERGDWVYFQNWVSARSCHSIGGMQGENAITQRVASPVTFIGLGIPERGGAPVAGQVILNILRNSWQNTGCPQSRVGQLRKDLVMTSSASYFQDLVEGLSLLSALEMDTPVTDLAGSTGTRKFFKLLVPAGTGNLNIRIYGGEGNSDLYVMREQWPTPANYDYSSISADNNERVELDNVTGTLYIMLDGVDDYSGLTLIADRGATPPPEDPCTNTIQIGTRDYRDSWIASCNAVHRQGRHAKYYSFTLERETKVSVSLESVTDTYLFLLQGSGAEGQIIARNDDYGRSFNSFIERTLPAGVYTIEATTYARGATGDFNLRIGGSTPDTCVVSVSPGQSINNQWESQCSSKHRRNRYAKYYTFTMSEPGEVVIDLVSETDTYLYLLHGFGRNGSIIARNDDSLGTYNSRIRKRLSAGRYTIEATTYAAQGKGPFTLSVH